MNEQGQRDQPDLSTINVEIVVALIFVVGALAAIILSTGGDPDVATELNAQSTPSSSTPMVATPAVGTTGHKIPR